MHKSLGKAFGQVQRRHRKQFQWGLTIHYPRCEPPHRLSTGALLLRFMTSLEYAHIDAAEDGRLKISNTLWPALHAWSLIVSITVRSKPWVSPTARLFFPVLLFTPTRSDGDHMHSVPMTVLRATAARPLVFPFRDRRQVPTFCRCPLLFRAWGLTW